MRRKAAFHNLGCRVNAYETEAMMERLQEAGYDIVPFDDVADVYVVNTCTVTSIADRKSRQMLHRAKQRNPHSVVVAVGCYVEDGREKLAKDPAVDLLIGNSGKGKLPELLQRYFAEHQISAPVSEDPDGLSLSEDSDALQSAEGPDALRTAEDPDVPLIASVRAYERLSVSRSEGRVRAFIKIQDGCNQFCTYCMIPYVRGRVRSRAPEDVLLEAKRLASSGYQELILTGIHISSYGMDFHEHGIRRIDEDSPDVTNEDLLSLVQNICRIEGVRRVRFGSLEPGIMSERFVAALSEEPKICPQFHLSLQSGSDAVLARMRRAYRTGQYAEICERLRNHFHNPAITTDVIVGFPGETEEEFSETMRFAGRIGFAKIHIFKYSRRSGTRAASMPSQIPESVKNARAAKLSALELGMRRAYEEQYVGNTCEVLIEEKMPEPVRQQNAKNRTVWIGHTRESVEILLPSESDLKGRILDVQGVSVTSDAKLLCELHSDAHSSV